MELKHKIDQIAMHFFKGNNTMFANKLNTSETNIRNYRNGKSIPKVDFIVSLSKELAINFDWLLGDFEQMVGHGPNCVTQETQTFALKTDQVVESQKVPLYDVQVAAGIKRNYNTDNIIDYISIPNLPKCDGAVKITGDSMYPLLKSGDIVLYKAIQDIENGILWGEMYLVSFMLDDELFTIAKYVQKSEKGEEWVKLVSQNSHHQPKDIMFSTIKGLAIVKASIRYNSMN